MRKCKKAVFAIFLMLAVVLCTFSVESHACTGIRLKTEDGNYIFARTLEFDAETLEYDLLFVPRNYKYTGQTTSGEPGMPWETKYAHVGFDPFGMSVVGDGLNEKGLACGVFFFPGYAGYKKVVKDDYPKTISCLDFASWVLSTCASVFEVRALLPEINVCGVEMPEWGYVPPLHYIVADDTGEAIIIEYTDGKLHIYDNEVNVITNSPDYTWHTTNLRNYIGLSPNNNPSIKIGEKEISQLGQGSGAIGLPGDFSPQSRFIRAAFFANSAYQGKDPDEGISVAFHILNQFDIPKGSIRDNEDGRVVADSTQWTSAADLTNRRYYYHTYHDRSVRMVDLDKLDLNARGISIIKDVQKPGKIKDVSAQL